MKKFIALFIVIGFLLQSCGNVTEKKTTEDEQTLEEIPTEFTSELRPNEKLELGKIYNLSSINNF